MTNSRFFLSIAAAMSFSASVDPVQLAHAQDAAASPGLNANVGGGCNTTKLAFKTSTSLDNTTSASFAPMPGTQRTITTSDKSCVIVDFSGEQASEGVNRMEIRAFASSVVGEPPSVLMGFAQPAPNFRTRSMRFVFKNLPAGTHNVGIAWRSENEGAIVSTRNRTLTIQYR
jgi:hypothetical protein